MEIEEVVKKYPERMKRDRRWFTFEEALVATGNNQYIKEAIQQSSINPATPRASTTDSPKIDISQFKKSGTQPHNDISGPSSHDSRKAKDAFQALQELMEKTSL